MSDTTIAPGLHGDAGTTAATAAQAPTVYFIDDSATMREVIKIAFRKENIQVVTCPSVAAAIEQFATVKPDAVISDVIMPDRDGYELCGYVKGHAELGKTPVILMSGVVNRTVAEKATVVKADELMRKPFQPQELVARVKKLLRGEAQAEAGVAEAAPGSAGATGPAGAPNASGGAAGQTEAGATNTAGALSGLFGQAMPPKPAAPAALPAHAAPAPPAEVHRPASPASGAPANTQARPSAPAASAAPQTPARPVAAAPAAPGADAQRLRFEIQRLELLVKKLQSELEAERQYCQALEGHIRALQGGA